MLGHKLLQVFRNRFDTFVTLRENFEEYDYLELFDKQKTFDSVNIKEFDRVKEIVELNRPDVIVNAIGVIKHKPEATDFVKTIEINSILPHKLANIAQNINARFITVSTDCVFDGQRGNYSELEHPNATDLYGKSKHLGEVVDDNCLTIRTSIIGREIGSGKSLVEWFLSNSDEEIKGFIRAIYSGFPTVVFAEILANLIENYPKLQGLYHVASDSIDKYSLLELIKRKLDLKATLIPFDEFEIDRSLDSTKFRNETNFVPESWEKMIDRMLDDPTPYKKWRKQVS